MDRQENKQNRLILSSLLNIIQMLILHDKGKGKCKVVPVLLLTEHHAMSAYWGSGITAPPIL
jgi:hypothetical protein